MSSHEGWFVLWDESKIVGYNYSKIMGNEGYLEPLGIIYCYQKRGLGSFNFKSTEYLIKNYNVLVWKFSLKMEMF